MIPKTREEAALKGEGRYFTGLSCINGHTALRRTDSGTCVECIKTSAAKRREYIKTCLAKKG